MRQLLVVEDGVEDQRVIADSFAAIDGVVAEEQHIALAEMSVDDDGVLGDGAALSSRPSSSRVLLSEKRRITSGRSSAGMRLRLLRIWSSLSFFASHGCCFTSGSASVILRPMGSSLSSTLPRPVGRSE